MEEEFARGVLQSGEQFEEFVRNLDRSRIVQLASEGTPFRRLLCLATGPFLLNSFLLNAKDKPEALLAVYNLEVSINPTETGGLLPSLHRPSIFHIPAPAAFLPAAATNMFAAGMSNSYTFRPHAQITRGNLASIRRRVVSSFQSYITEMPKLAVQEYCKVIEEADLFINVMPFIRANYSDLPLPTFDSESSALYSLSTEP